MKEKIELIENKTLLVFCEPQRLRDIADSLERQQERYKVMESGIILVQDTAEQPDSLSCQIHNGNVNIWFRLPIHNKHLDK